MIDHCSISKCICSSKKCQHGASRWKMQPLSPCWDFECSCTEDQFFLEITAMPVFIDNAAFVSKMRRSSQAIKQRSLLSKKVEQAIFFTKENKCYIYLLDFENRATWATDAKSCHTIRFFLGKEKHVSSKKIKAPFRNSSVTSAHAQCGPYHCMPSTNMQSGNSPPTPFFSKGDTPKKKHKPHATSVAHFHHPLVKANFVSLLLGGACVHPIVHFANPQLLHPVGHFANPHVFGPSAENILLPSHHYREPPWKSGRLFCANLLSIAHHTEIKKEMFYHLNMSYLRSEVGPGPPFPRPLQSGHWSNWQM